MVLLGESVQEILHSRPFLDLVAAGSQPEEWAAGYVERRRKAERAEQEALKALRQGEG